ncbi:MAG: hypothetical protein LBJ11_02930 [Oscillospiraceae bacterium]|jgi:hypothetical protein|nr:hypothetical protein [Oscillospiraceae bacterium]
MKCKHILALGLAALLLCCAAGCGPKEPEVLDNAAVDAIKVSRENENASRILAEAPALGEPVTAQKQALSAFLYENSCFSYLRDQGFYRENVRRTDYLSQILSTYPGGTVRQMDGTAYVRYDTDAGIRVFLFFPADMQYRHMAGHAILCAKPLRHKDFERFEVGSSMGSVAGVDPVARTYALGYNQVNPGWFGGGKEVGSEIVTIHLLEDGILRYSYDIVQENGVTDYRIKEIEFSADFTLPELDGQIRYAVLPEDYPT